MVRGLCGRPAHIGVAAALRWLRGTYLQRAAALTVAEQFSGVGDPQLRGVLGSRWGDCGPPPGRGAPFVEHTLVTGADDDGAY